MEEMTIWEQHTITLIKDSKVGFGFAISGGRDKPSPDTGDTIVISDVVRNGPAEGRLHIRDQVAMVNGVSLENVTSIFTIQHLKSCGKTANITIKRPRKIQLPATTRPIRSASHSNLLSDDPPPGRRPRRSSDAGNDSYGRRARHSRSSSPERNGHTLPLMSGFKRLPKQEAPSRPIRATLLKKKLTDEYGLKLGSQIFIKHMTNSGLAAKEGTLEEGDLVLKINGMTTENLSLLETKHLVEKSRGKLTMLVLRDDRKFLVSIPEVTDSAPNSEEDRRGNSSSELEDISDLDSELNASTRDRVSRERRTRRHHRAETSLPSRARDSSPVRSTLTRPLAHSQPPRRAPSDSDSDRSPSPRPGRDTIDRSKYGTLSGIALPNPRSSPVPRNLEPANWAPPRPSSASSRPPRKAVSDSDSDRSASPPPRRESPRPDSHTRYRVLPDLPHPGLRASPLTLRQDSPYRGPSPMRARPIDDSESESDGSSGPPRRQGTPASQDSRSRYRDTLEKSPSVEPPRWIPPTNKVPSLGRGRSESGSEVSNDSYTRNATSSSRDFRESLERNRVLPEMRSSPPLLKQDSPPRGTTPVRAPSEDSSESERAPSPPRRVESADLESTHSYSPSVNNTLRSGVSLSSGRPVTRAPPEEEPLYSLPPDSYPTYNSRNSGYSSDQNKVRFVKEGSVGLRLVGGNDVGIFVGGVQPNSPAQLQGMTEGDQIIKVNDVDFSHFTREDAAMFLLNIRAGEQVDIITQNKKDIYRKIMKSGLGDSFYIRTHFDYEAEGPKGLSFTRGEVLRVLDTMYRGKLGNWLTVRMGNDLHELDRGTVPNQTRAETLATIEQSQRTSGADKQASGLRAEFWKLRGLRGAKKNVRKGRDDLLQLTIQGKYPAYERVLLREASFKRPIVILGPINDIAMEKLAREMPDEFEVADMVARGGGSEGSSSVIKLDTVRRISEKDKHPLLDITPTAIERLNYIQYHPLVLFLDPHSRKDVKAMRQRLSPDSNKSSRRLYAQALKLRKYYSHLFAGCIDLQPSSYVWYNVLREKIREQQAKPVWVSEVTLEGGGDDELDALERMESSDYLSCDSRANSDYDDTDGEAYTDGELYTDNDDLEESGDRRDGNPTSRRAGTALARSSEPALEREGSSRASDSYPRESYDRESYNRGSYNRESYPEDASVQEIPPIMHVPKPQAPHYAPESPPPAAEVPSSHSFSDSPSDFSVTGPAAPSSPYEEPPSFRAPDPRSKAPAEALPEANEAVTLHDIEEKLRQTREAGPQERPTPALIVCAHQTVQIRRSQIQGSDSSAEDDESDDQEWGPATEL